MTAPTSVSADLLMPRETAPPPRTLYANLICDLLRDSVVSSPPKCQHYMDASDFEAMNDHVKELIGRTQAYIASLGRICAENGGGMDTSAFTDTLTDALSDLSGYLITAAENYRNEHIMAAE